ncbi:MAG: nitrogen fixation protein NifX [Gammaproteobacteria bacterium]|nr:nitrogen fixation protein NifX [Gammaproteobacteria bacterium]MCP5423972.1 nitrogen fixation protein NifX [Gammaproteobacteria bacterium]MCP5459451.1 nitrogen fixation protein NifX [Gammaproteobacteria bacterium]
MTSHEGLTRSTALRIGLAARALPDATVESLMRVLVSSLGMPLTDAKLDSVSVKLLKTAQDGAFSEIEPIYLKQAVGYLKGELGLEEVEIPQPQSYQEGDMPDSIRVAFSSNSGARLDGHFGSCQRFLIYQVSADSARLVDVRPVVVPELQPGEDRAAYLVDHIRDCHILYVVSIGGPPAARVVNAGIHPVKNPQPVEISELLPRLQQVLAGTPPPWLSKIIGRLPVSAPEGFKSSEAEDEP